LFTAFHNFRDSKEFSLSNSAVNWVSEIRKTQFESLVESHDGSDLVKVEPFLDGLGHGQVLADAGDDESFFVARPLVVLHVLRQSLFCRGLKSIQVMRSQGPHEEKKKKNR
jgi:hypothetical protein